MPVTLRRLQPGEETAFLKSVRVPFLDPNTGSAEDDAADQPRAARLETERMWVAEDRGQFVGNGGVRTMDLTVPASPGRACPIVRMGGVTAVGIHPTHRRRGLLTQMMSRMLDDCRERGEPLAGLIASESIIYGRFGFGLASDSAEYRIDSSRSAFKANPAPRDIRLIDHFEAAKILPTLFDTARTARAGEPNRTPEFWEEVLADKPTDRHGASGLFFAATEDGYVGYRAKRDADILRGERAEVVVEEVAAADPGVQAALWRFVLDLDLIGHVTFRRRPLDEPVRWRLADPRQLQTKAVYDRLHLRILDVPGALTARGYSTEAQLTIDVLPDDTAGEDPAIGAWSLEAGPHGAHCARAKATAPADICLSVTTLGSLYLGGASATTLAAAGLVEELTPGSIATANRLFAAAPAPSTVTGF
ncbi:MAG TPA: GNAT family N-acetyltransferase [Acidimicrobiales bacterium]|nr:GNAT family N-acetyltransferase [Acidimicrobiales bacterium]